MELILKAKFSKKSTSSDRNQFVEELNAFMKNLEIWGGSRKTDEELIWEFDYSQSKYTRSDIVILLGQFLDKKVEIKTYSIKDHKNPFARR